jgi:hypothetical protein
MGWPIASNLPAPTGGRKCEAGKEDLMRYAFIVLFVVGLAAGCKGTGDVKKPSQTIPTPTPAAKAAPTPAAAESAPQWKTVEEFVYAGGPALAPVRFKLEIPEGYRHAGDFIRIHIQVKGQPDFVVDNKDGWVKTNNQDDPSEVYAHLENKNLVDSKYVLIVPASRGKSDPPLVLLRSWGYASDAERLHVIGFQKRGKPVVLLNEELDLLELADLDGDGNFEIAGSPCLGQGYGNDLSTYDPPHVYKIPHPITGPAILSIPLSKNYSLQHYYGWAGPDCSEKLAVVLHPPGGGKPLIMDADAAAKLMEKGERKKK